MFARFPGITLLHCPGIGSADISVVDIVVPDAVCARDVFYFHEETVFGLADSGNRRSGAARCLHSRGVRFIDDFGIDGLDIIFAFFAGGYKH